MRYAIIMKVWKMVGWMKRMEQKSFGYYSNIFNSIVRHGNTEKPKKSKDKAMAQH